VRAAIMALAHDIALAPFAFGWVASLPGLHVGETRFEPEFPRGGISGGMLALAQAALDRVDVQNAERRHRAETFADRIGAETRFQPLLAPVGQGVYPRLALLAPNAAARDASLARLTRLGVGASPLYPESLDALTALAPYRVGSGACPAARDLAARIITVSARIRAESRRGTRVVAALRRNRRG
jgi:dTDP-4-amino-4,6-dideoxygalactose transaminase